MSTEQGYLRIKGLRVYYREKGNGEAVVLLHGGLGTVDDFASQITEFAKHFRVIAFERPGHGHTADTDEPFAFDAMAEVTVGFIEALNLGAVNLVGWSDGAIVALLVSISRPDLIKSIVSIGGLFNASSQAPQVLDWIKASTPESFRKSEPAVVERYDNATPDGPEHFSKVFEKTKRLWLNEPNIALDELAKIKARALVMAGDKDATPLQHTSELFRAIKGAQLCIVPGTTHFLLSERPDIVNEIIIHFLKNN